MRMGSGEVEKIKNDFQQVKIKYKELQKLRAELTKKEVECSKAVSEVRQALKDEKKSFNATEASNDFKTMTDKLRDMATTFPQPPTFILKMILGDISVTLNNSDSRLRYKQEYEKFKLCNTTMIMILCVISLVFYDLFLPSALVHCASVWYYFTVTLRELVLKTNGSKIKWWWLAHHYCSILMAIIFLIWPPGSCYKIFKSQFMLFSLVLSCVMTLQFRYQRAKLYRQVAMGQSHTMSISQESQVSLVFDFTFLVICLSGVYIFQFYNAYTLLKYFLHNKDCFLWGVLMLSIMFFVVGLLNSFTLLSVLYSKCMANLSNTRIKKLH